MRNSNSVGDSSGKRFASRETAEPVAEDSQVAEKEDTTADLAEQLRVALEQRDQLAAEVEELKERLLRRQADFENHRKRTDRERAEFAQYAGMETIRELLPILDDFERACQVECLDSEYAKGMELIYQRLTETLKKFGLEPMETVGVKFDPNLHHAIDKMATDEVEPDTILGEYQRGYNFKGRLLRPAVVKVAVQP